MSSKSFRNKNIQRPKKSALSRRRREMEHRKRLMALGMSEEEVARLNTKELRQLLRKPARTAKMIEKRTA